MIKSKKLPPYIRDVYLSYLIRGARMTEEGFPIIEDWMVSNEIPENIVQWDCRDKIKGKANTAISFYCNDQYFQPILSNPKNYLEKLSSYAMVIGMDASPYDNMPLIVQLSQIYINLAITYYFGRNGLKIVPNIRLGIDETACSLKAYPRQTLISIGTNGFVNNKENNILFSRQVKTVIDNLSPTGILVYGTMPKLIFDYPRSLQIPIYDFESFIHKRRRSHNEGK